MIKLSYIRKLPNGRWRVFSEKGKNLGTFNSRELAQKRLKQIEMFKHMNKRKRALLNLFDIVKEADIEPFYSFIMRDKNKIGEEELFSFMSNFKKIFDEELLKGNPEPEVTAMEKSNAS